ncbi:rhodanese-like domain-containing protein [Paenibacillus thermoaerophilus]|uniref:Rhodanese-like domain-containing protein n=1 Tax=Paenibacillus thermoaerophilus TaxID=1215385 RepID=A0ABW2V6L6_9BACL|nr:rhodanese-like domain-containing protein [Paenibacillus thermoaerophilus]TMV18736.1 rhodanese-like domain-containing protein [Paenibacillus thermoaerophilus]
MNRIDPETFTNLYTNKELDDALVIDVREAQELEHYALEDAEWIPMNSIPERLAELPKDKDLYIVCAHGMRSARVCQFLEANGYRRVHNVEGGMAAVSWHKDGFQYD